MRNYVRIFCWKLLPHSEVQVKRRRKSTYTSKHNVYTKLKDSNGEVSVNVSVKTKPLTSGRKTTRATESTRANKHQVAQKSSLSNRNFTAMTKGKLY